jgi:hypothetical protein
MGNCRKFETNALEKNGTFCSNLVLQFWCNDTDSSMSRHFNALYNLESTCKTKY